MVDLLIQGLLVSLAINMVMFLVAYKLQSDKLTDISYAASFATLAVVAFVNGSRGGLQVVLLGLVLAWSVRIGGFLLYRVMKTGKDKRFDGIRDNFRKFGVFWLGQALTVWVLMIPALFAFKTHGNGVWLALIGGLLWLVGLVIETTADFQKLTFSRNAQNKDKWIDSGVWRYSRHPNYFGEILVWVGVYISCLQLLSTMQAVVGLVSPVFITILLLFISGIPPLERMADERWGHVAAYRAYKRQTSVLVPLPKRRQR